MNYLDVSQHIKVVIKIQKIELLIGEISIVITQKQKEILEKVKEANIDCGHSTFKIAIKDMVDKGAIFSKKGQKNKTLYSLEPFGE